MKKNLLTTLLFIFILSPTYAQKTVGLLSYEPAKAYDGYNLFFPHNQPNVYLLDNCGEIVHIWEDDINWRPGNIAYLRPDGTLVKAKRDAAIGQDAIWAGGGGEVIEIRDWDNELLWSYELNNDTARLHHDIAPMNNGNILAIAWELKTEAECLQAGRDTSTTAQDKLWPDYIIELNPETDEIVWEWHAWDHLVQDFDSTKDNFGIVEDHPEKIDINYDIRDGHPDWHHANSIDFDEFNNLIMVSVPYFDEIWVIDHSTTAAQAAGSTGGFSGKGGDLMYRWGNPATYKQGEPSDQLSFFQHDAHFINSLGNPYNGQIAIFNNMAGSDFSQVNVIQNTFDMYTFEFPLDENIGFYGPYEYEETIKHPVDETLLFSTGLSSAQFLPNGNTLITDGRHGYNFEVTPNDEIVWEYVTPFAAGSPVTQGDSLDINQNLTFRMKRYAADYEAFDGRDLSPMGWIELEADSLFCDQILPTSEVMENYYLKVFPNPANNRIVIEWEGGIYADVMIYDILGREMDKFRATGGRKYLDISNYEAGMYFVEIEGREVTRFIKE